MFIRVFVWCVGQLAFGLERRAEVLCAPGFDLFDAAGFEGLMHDLGGGCADGRAESEEQAGEAGFLGGAGQRFVFAERGLQHFGRAGESFVGMQGLALVGHESHQVSGQTDGAAARSQARQKVQQVEDIDRMLIAWQVFVAACFQRALAIADGSRGPASASRDWNTSRWPLISASSPAALGTSRVRLAQ